MGRRRAGVAGRPRRVGRRADLAPVGERGAARAAARRGRAPAGGAPRARGGGGARGAVGVVVGAALLSLYFSDQLAPARDTVLPVVVVLVAATLILAPF